MKNWVITPKVKTPEFIKELMNMIKEDVLTPYFFPKGLKINMDEYINVLRDVVKPWMDRVGGYRLYIFQQDGGPAHDGGCTQDWCTENLRGFWSRDFRPPSSPDCNPLDSYVWGVFMRDVNWGPHNIVVSLKRGITWVMEYIERASLVRAYKRFRHRIEMMVAVHGDFIN